jgi:hypothetical protein
MPDFNEKDAKSTFAAAGLCALVRNMVDYHQVEKFVRPKKETGKGVIASLENPKVNFNLSLIN